MPNALRPDLSGIVNPCHARARYKELIAIDMEIATASFNCWHCDTACGVHEVRQVFPAARGAGVPIDCCHEIESNIVYYPFLHPS